MAQQQANPGTDRYSMAELMTVCMARALAGEEEKRGGGGANAIIPLAAGRLAQITVAPNLWLTTGGAGSMNGKFDTLPIGTWDPRCDSRAECKNYMMDVVDSAIRGRKQGTRMSFASIAGLGGMQIDQYGNSNMIGIPASGTGAGRKTNLKVRGPGTVGTIWLGSGPTSNYTEHHSKRIFVERVAFRSGAGWLEGRKARYDTLDGRDGPPYCWTPICVCDFTPDEHRMRLLSVHPGYTVDDVIANTGFELVIEGDVPQTTPPTDWELTVLRTQVDRAGRLRKRRVTVGE
jgi:glutaconate CoA-transferase, subunit B